MGGGLIWKCFSLNILVKWLPDSEDGSCDDSCVKSEFVVLFRCLIMSASHRCVGCRARCVHAGMQTLHSCVHTCSSVSRSVTALAGEFTKDATLSDWLSLGSSCEQKPREPSPPSAMSLSSSYPPPWPRLSHPPHLSGSCPLQ